MGRDDDNRMKKCLPAIGWPTELREAGPTADPSILLVGDAKIGTTDYSITAVRINKYLTGPDYKPELDERLYEKKLNQAIDALDFLMEVAEPDLLSLEDGMYLLWMVPADLE